MGLNEGIVGFVMERIEALDVPEQPAELLTVTV